MFAQSVQGAQNRLPNAQGYPTLRLVPHGRRLGKERQLGSLHMAHPGSNRHRLDDERPRKYVVPY